MNYYNLRSIVSPQKQPFPMQVTSESFAVAKKREQPYIEPDFAKIEFEVERPAVILVSAVGATGKSTLAQVLSHDTGMPLLDLAKHKPVGDNTLTGLLTNSLRVEDLSRVFEGIGTGTYGVIIDGIDEGRSKTTEKAFEAFLDDIVRLCIAPKSASFVLLGRTQILEDCWLYLAEKQVTVGLVEISPFGLESARKYIDCFSKGQKSSHAAQYEEARDSILTMLGAAFADIQTEDAFLRFIGYPPVLDAISTLLREERDFHRIQGELQGPDSDDVEITLLTRITSYILRREKLDKIMLNIVGPLIADMPNDAQDEIREQVFTPEEQAMRLISYCLERPLNLNRIQDRLISEKYEAQLLSFLPEHPFISGRHFRNVVFESVALATLIAAGDPLGLDLVEAYAAAHKYNYHLVYFLKSLASEGKVPIRCLHIILGSALEFRSRTTSIEMQVEGGEPEEFQTGGGSAHNVETQIDIVLSEDRSRSFVFHSDLRGETCVRLGRRLSSTYVSLPSDVSLSGTELELTAPVEIYAKRILLESADLVLRHPPDPTEDTQVLLAAERVDSVVGNIVTNGVRLILAVADRSGLAYPAIRYAVETARLPQDPLLSEKYLRLRKILVLFRSHSRGSLAKLKDKIETERIGGNPVGAAIMARLIQDDVLYREGKFYFLVPENIDKHLGISYMDLRRGEISERLLDYLRAVN